MTVEEVAQLLNTSVAVEEFTPKKFKQVYKNTWINEHESQAKIQTNTAKAALAIIEEVKDSSVKQRLPLKPTPREMAVAVPTLPLLLKMMAQLEMEGNLCRLLQGLYRQLSVYSVSKERGIFALRIEAGQPRTESKTDVSLGFMIHVVEKCFI